MIVNGRARGGGGGSQCRLLSICRSEECVEGEGEGVRQSTTTTTTTINLNNIYCYREINWPEFADIETHANVLEGGCYLLSPSNPSFFTRYGKLRAIPIDTTTATNPIR